MRGCTLRAVGHRDARAFGWLPRDWCGWSLLGSLLLAPEMVFWEGSKKALDVVYIDFSERLGALPAAAGAPRPS